VYGRHSEAEPGSTVDLTEDLAPAYYATAEGDELQSDPFADDLDSELAARASRKVANRTTTVLLGLVLLVGGFVAGAQVQKHFGASNTSAGNAGSGAGAGNGAAFGGGNFGGGTGNFGGGRGNGGGNGGSTAATSNTMTGTVKLVDGTTVYIQMANGDLLTVRTTASTTVQVAQPGALSQLAPGTQVTVEGQSGGEGIVNATKVTATK
jgi:hypothetical protein